MAKKSTKAEDESLAARKIKSNRYKSFKLQKRISPEGGKLPGVFRLFGRSLATLWRNPKVFLGIIAVYGLLNVILVYGFTAVGDVSEIKKELDNIFTGNWAQLATGATLFLQILGSAGNEGNPAAGAYQLMLLLLVSLALIWTLRQVYSGNKVRIRDSFYLGMAPLVQFLLVLFVVTLQLLPAFLGAFIFSQVTSAGVVVSGAEYVLWGTIFFILALVSLYMLSSSLFALYIVSLPDMTPLRALRSARELVRYRRWVVMRKIIFLPVALIVLAALIVIPLVIFVTPLATWAFFAFNMVAIAIIHSYMYALYRSLL